jgi:hypothetical protein
LINRILKNHPNNEIGFKNSEKLIDNLKGNNSSNHFIIVGPALLGSRFPLDSQKNPNHRSQSFDSHQFISPDAALGIIAFY